ncbi:MAG: alpha/beta hydrolase [Phycisphaeraceae bacterium]|nr:MAG: alpha/beta hydrolase [Phycisphaeraceae bacterium]
MVPTTSTTQAPASRAEDAARWSVFGPGSELFAKVGEAGVGRPVVFLHGLVGLNDHWEAVAESVRSRARCVMFELPLLDLPGEHCSIAGVTSITKRFLDERVGEPAILVGNSFGGHVALRLAIEHPSAVRGMVLAGSSGLFERTIFRDLVIRPSREWLARKIGDLFYDKSNVWESDIDRAYAALTQRHAARAMARLAKSAKSDHLGDRLGRITAPTLLLWGRNDTVTPPETAEEFNRLIPGSRLVWFDRCGHAPMMEHANAFASRMGEFLAELDATTGRP